jgi:N-acyl-D-glutamate deacylase
MSDNQFDLAIMAGRVIDPETGLDDVRNVGVRGNKIAAVTSETITGDWRTQR